MKLAQTVLSLVIVGLTAAVGYYFFASSALDYRVEKQGEKLQQVSQQAQDHEVQIGKQGQEIGNLKADVSKHAVRLAELEKRAGEVDAKMRQTEARMAAAEQAASKDRETLEAMGKEIQTLRSSYDQIVKELDAARAKESLRDDFLDQLDRRLREVEKRAAVVPPTP